jgi:hypothetical protein
VAVAELARRAVAPFFLARLALGAFALLPDAVIHSRMVRQMEQALPATLGRTNSYLVVKKLAPFASCCRELPYHRVKMM